MAIITQTKRYLPHEISTKVKSVQLYRLTKDISFVCRRYHISKASLMRWNKLYDGTRESLLPKSHRSYTVHPNAHTAEEIRWISNLHRRNPNISVCEMYSKLREQHAYSRRPDTVITAVWRDVYLLGDVDGDGTITVFDASLIQKKIAGVELQQFNELAADVDGDGYITVFDASYIQRFLAGYHDPPDIGKPF